MANTIIGLKHLIGVLQVMIRSIIVLFQERMQMIMKYCKISQDSIYIHSDVHGSGSCIIIDILKDLAVPTVKLLNMPIVW